MRKLFVSLMAVGICLGLSGMAGAAANDTQTVGYEVSAINELSVSGDPAAMNVSTATAGVEPDAVSDATTTFAITTNCGDNGKKITASINTAMPSGVTLNINLAAPTGAVSSGDTDISNANVTALDVVTGIDGVAESAKTITYKLDATVAAGVVASATKTVTLTISDS